MIRTSGSDASCAPPFGGFLGSVKGEETPKAQPKPSGEMLYFVWPGNALRFPRRNWKVSPGSSGTPKGFKGTRCLKKK